MYREYTWTAARSAASFRLPGKLIIHRSFTLFRVVAMFGYLRNLWTHRSTYSCTCKQALFGSLKVMLSYVELRPTTRRRYGRHKKVRCLQNYPHLALPLLPNGVWGLCWGYLRVILSYVELRPTTRRRCGTWPPTKRKGRTYKTTPI